MSKSGMKACFCGFWQIKATFSCISLGKKFVIIFVQCACMRQGICKGHYGAWQCLYVIG